MAANMSMKVRVDAFTNALRTQFFSFCAVHFLRRFFVRTAAPPVQNPRGKSALNVYSILTESLI
jgi:hypothetical protein